MSWAVPKTVLGDKIIWDLSKIPGEYVFDPGTGIRDQPLSPVLKYTAVFTPLLISNLPDAKVEKRELGQEKMISCGDVARRKSLRRRC